MAGPLPSRCPLWTHGHLRRLEFTKIIGELKGRGHFVDIVARA